MEITLYSELSNKLKMELYTVADTDETYEEFDESMNSCFSEEGDFENFAEYIREWGDSDDAFLEGSYLVTTFNLYTKNHRFTTKTRRYMKDHCFCDPDFDETVTIEPLSELTFDDRFVEIAEEFFRYSFADIKKYSELTSEEQKILSEKEFELILKRIK